MFVPGFQKNGNDNQFVFTLYVPYLMNSEDVNLELVFLGQAGP